MTQKIEPEWITLRWMNLIRKRMKEKDILLNSKEWKFIQPIYDYGLEQERQINIKFREE